jgi:hypothetical protein
MIPVSIFYSSRHSELEPSKPATCGCPFFEPNYALTPQFPLFRLDTSIARVARTSCRFKVVGTASSRISIPRGVTWIYASHVGAVSSGDQPFLPTTLYSSTTRRQHSFALRTRPLVALLNGDVPLSRCESSPRQAACVRRATQDRTATVTHNTRAQTRLFKFRQKHNRPTSSKTTDSLFVLHRQHGRPKSLVKCKQ